MSGRSGVRWRLMTMSVSRDGGRTYGPVVEVTSDDVLFPSGPAEWPPCECPRHRTARQQGRELPESAPFRFDGS